MDSREYVFIFPVNGPAEVPSDFRAPVHGRAFETGIFLPQDDANWFPRYPARLVLLSGRELYIIPHPTANELETDLRLDELVQIETGSVLLAGWIQLTTGVATHRLSYNTRASDAVDRFLAVVRRKWLGAAPHRSESADQQSFGHDLDIKFRNLLRDALDSDELVLSRYFAAPIEYQVKFFAFRRMKCRPGHVIAITSGNRVLWLKDEYRGRRDRYAGITVSAPLSRLLNSAVEAKQDHDELVIQFLAGVSWRISINRADRECVEFSRSLKVAR